MNDLEIQVLGMSRSGNHAIVDWIFEQAEGPKLLLNCAEGGTNPFQSCRPLASGKGWRAEPEIDFNAASRGCHEDRRLLVHTYEDSWLDYVFSAELEEHGQEWLGQSRRKISMLVLRDPYNLFASRKRMGRNLPPDIARDLWKQHAREALGDTHELRSETLIVLYNRWQSDKNYRREIVNWLGLQFSDRGIDSVPECAGGSSFDGTAFDGKATAMATDRRWTHFADDEGFRQFFDNEMVQLTERLYGLPLPIPLRRPARRKEINSACLGHSDAEQGVQV